MKKTSIQIIFGIIIGIAATWAFMNKFQKQENPEIPESIHSYETTYTNVGDSATTNCPNSKGITSNDAKKLIYDYCSTTNCLVSPDSTKKIRGFYLDRTHIETIFSSHPEADGIMVCLARQGSMPTDPHTIVWMGYDCVNVEGAGDSINLVYDDAKKTIFDFVQPCPHYCPQISNSMNNLWPIDCDKKDAIK